MCNKGETDPRCCGLGPKYCDMGQQLQMGADLVHRDCGGAVYAGYDRPVSTWYHYCGGEGGDECCTNDNPKYKNVPPTLCRRCDQEIFGDFMMEARWPDES